MDRLSNGGAAARVVMSSLALSCTLALLGGCAASIPAQPVELAALPTSPADLEFEKPLEIRLGTGYTRVVPAASRWRAVGRVAQGTVYRPLNTIFAIEGRNVHEAYLVIQNSALQGFYLPGESRYSPLAAPLPIPVGAKP